MVQNDLQNSQINHLGRHSVRKGKQANCARLSPVLYLLYQIYFNRCILEFGINERYVYIERKPLLCSNTTTKGTPISTPMA